MPFIIQYLLKLSVSIAVIHAFYYLVLRRLTFYNLNRWYLLGYMLLCLGIPFINISGIADEADKTMPAINYIPTVQNIQGFIPHYVQAAPRDFNIWNAVIFLLITGSVILLARLVVQCLSFIGLKSKAKVISDTDAVIYHVDEQIMPFSFGRSIYLNKGLHSDQELEDIIMHEYVHVKQMHSTDILIAELFCIVNWYNPFAWFMRHSIRQNLEFIADDNVVRSGLDKKTYQYHLLKVVGIPQYRIANQFNFSSLKKRIIMMNRVKTAKIHLLKFMFILPLLAVTLLAFREDITNTIAKGLPASIKMVPNLNFADIPAKGFYEKDTTSKAAKNLALKKEAASNDDHIHGVSTDSAYVDKSNKAIILYGDAVVSNKTGKLEGSTIKLSTDTTLGHINFQKALVLVDGKEIKLSAIQPSQIESITVLRSGPAISLYGKKGKDGALVYVLKGNNIAATGKDSDIVVKGYRISSSNKTFEGSTLPSYAIAASSPSYAVSATNGSYSGKPTKVLYVMAPNADEVVYTFDPQHLQDAQLEATKKKFADNGFKFEINPETRNGVVSKITINLSSKNKNRESSATYVNDDLKDGKFYITITANKKTGSVGIRATPKETETKPAQ